MQNSFYSSREEYNRNNSFVLFDAMGKIVGRFPSMELAKSHSMRRGMAGTLDTIKDMRV